MSDEREQARIETEQHREVSSLYRELAQEQTPDHLDTQVLKDAKRAARSGYARSRRWTRPLAWAAMIMLCLAITLQLTRLPGPETLPPGLPPGTADAPSSESEFSTDTATTDALPAALQPKRAAPSALRMPESRSSEKTGTGTARDAGDLGETAAQDCDDETRRSVETWLACIERLEKNGFLAEAEGQRELLAEAFPRAGTQ